MPAVSIVVPNYNHARFLPQRIESILRQTHQEWELIVLDDASTDDSHAVIARYLADPRIRFHPNATNSGSPFFQWNRGVALARHDYVWLAESDDFAAPDLLSRLLAMLTPDPTVSLAYAQSHWVDSNGAIVGDQRAYTDRLEPGRWLSDFVASGPTECARYLIRENTIPNASGVLFRRQAYLDAGGAPTDMRLCGDWMMWVKMLHHGRIAHHAGHLNFFRRHAATMRATTPLRGYFIERCAVQRFIFEHFEVPREVRSAILREVLKDLRLHLRAADPGQRTRTLALCLGAAWPILRRAPVTLAATAGRAVRSRFRRRA